MSSVYDDGDSIRKARERFIADVALRDPLPHDRPTKFFIDVLFTAINTGLLKDIQVCGDLPEESFVICSGF